MAEDPAFRKQVQRIGELVEQLESFADRSSLATAKELLESLMALHGAGLERILEIAAGTGEAGATIIEKCGHDELLSSLLLLYGLHPEDLPTRVQRAVHKLGSYLNKHNASVELLSVREDGGVTLRLEMPPGGCASTEATVRATVEAAIEDAAPDATSLELQASAAALTRSGFVSLAQLKGGQALAAWSAPRASAPRSGD
jgi:Fe-S cluster biogenesis protein NfuA